MVASEDRNVHANRGKTDSPDCAGSSPEQGPADIASSVAEALETRRSVRAFTAEPVPMATIERILALAARAPSGTNLQPWHVDVLTDAALARFVATMLAHFDDPDIEPVWEYAYYPPAFREPYISRRRKVGWDLYGLLGIEKGDKARMTAQHRRNYQFFDAPVGMIVTIDADLTLGSWIDTGMFIQSVLLAARGEGLHGCAQAAFAHYGVQVREALGLGEDRRVVCGIALGHEDRAQPENALRTEREPLANFVRFHGG